MVKRNARPSRFKAALGLMACLCAPAPFAAAEEAPLPKEKIEALIKDLGSDEFDKRSAAEAALIAAGNHAAEALKAAEASNDPQIKLAASRLAARVRMQNLGPVDYLATLPANTMMGGYLSNVEQTRVKAEKTIVGRLLNSPELKPFHDMIDKKLADDPREAKEFELWYNAIKGQAIAAVWQLDFMNPMQIRAGLMIEASKDDGPKLLDSAMKGMRIGKANAANHQGVDIFTTEPGMGSVALVQRHMMLGANTETLKELVDNIAKPGGLKAAPSYASLPKTMTENPDFLFVYDIQAYMAALQKMMANMGGMGGPNFMGMAGVDGVKMMALSTHVDGDVFEDRFIETFDPQKFAFSGAMNFPPDFNGTAALSAVPATACAAMTSYMDGGKLWDPIVNYARGFADMALKMNQGVQAPPGVAVDDAIRQFNEQNGIDAKALVSGIKGEMAYWLVLAPGAGMAPPDICAFLTFADEAKAKAFSETVIKILNKEAKRDVVAVADYNGHSLQTLDPTLLELKKDSHYTFAWTVSGNRLYLASSTLALQRQVAHVTKKSPGLDTSETFKAAYASLKPEDQKGAVTYVDMKRLLVLGGTAGLAAAQALPGDEEMKKVLGGLPAPEVLFKDFTPLIATSRAQGDKVEAVIRSPIPVMGAVGVAVASGFLFARGAARAPVQAPQVAPPPAEKAPGF